MTAAKLVGLRGVSLVRYIQQKNADDPESVAIGNLLKTIPQMKEYLFNDRLKKVVQALDKNLILRAVLFERLKSNHWYVPWHQDKTIRVAEKMKADGFSGWTRKDGAWSVIPPVKILQNTFTLRIHLDDTDERNGCLQVLPASHKKLFAADEENLIVENALPQKVEVLAGGVHILKPLLLHASPKATVQRRRRVIHLEFCAGRLPDGMEWAEREAPGEG